MEVKEKSKKRELIKSIAIVFLTVLLLLTFFSNTIMNRSLPEVATQSISSGTINAKIRGSGTVSANESYEVIINQTRQVRSVCVGVGDTVQQGDLLFVLENVESQELKDAQEQLDSLNLQYEQQLLTLSRDYASEDRTIEVLREDLAKATKQRDENKVTEEEISYAKGDLAAAKKELDQIALVLGELEAMMGDSDAYAQAQEAVTKWKGESEAAQAKMNELEEKLAQAGSGNGADLSALQEELAKAQNAAAAAQRELETAQSALADAQSIYQSSYDALKAEAQKQMMSDHMDITNTANLDVYMQSIAMTSGNTSWQEAYTVFAQCNANLAAAQNKLAAANATVTDCADRIAGYTGDQSLISTLTQQYNTAASEYTAAQYQLQQANYALAQAENQNAALKNQLKSYEAAQRQQTAYVSELTDSVAGLESKKTLYDQAVALVSEKERAIEDALTGKSIDRQLDDLSLQSIQMQIDKAQELVDKYTADSIDTEIKANVSGLITAINVTPGKENTAGVAMATIDIVDRGYIIKIPVTNEQSKQVRVGDTAKVSNYYWGENVEATLEAITADPSNPGKGKLLVFRVTGDIDAGANITLSIGQRSANYDTIIPKSALREDTNGYFVLVITVKSSPLSNRYFATRVDVQVLAQDDTSAAVSGLSAGDFVITTSSKPVEAGTQVRMVENP